MACHSPIRQASTAMLLIASSHSLFMPCIAPAAIAKSASQSLQRLSIRVSPPLAAKAEKQGCREPLALDERRESQSATTVTPPRQRNESQTEPSISARYIGAATPRSFCPASSHREPRRVRRAAGCAND